MNTYSLAWSFRMLGVIPGVSEERPRCTNYAGRCKDCLKTIRWPRGLFCTNFAWSLGGSHSCQSVWCGSCYTSDNRHKFFCQYDERELHKVIGANGEKMNLWKHKSPNERQFLEARDGDMLLSPFVCHVCIFFILKRRSPSSNSRADELLVSVIKRAVLDSLWSRTRSTVRQNMNWVLANMKNLEAYGLTGSFYDPGPTPLYDCCGWECAISFLIDTLGKGTYFE
mmetsp:Transcript_5795/g.8888  ORF Transcript_5795/g.8888 Transcript_5795/m.8888 type:complete len:225 (-) Transcript_5795:293-967(-)